MLKLTNLFYFATFSAVLGVNGENLSKHVSSLLPAHKIIVNGIEQDVLTLENFTDVITSIDISNNSLNLLILDLLKVDLSSLVNFTATNSSITSIQNIQLPNLKFLNVSHNRITNLQDALPCDASNLEYLDVTFNSLKSFEYNATVYKNIVKLYKNIRISTKSISPPKSHSLGAAWIFGIFFTVSTPIIVYLAFWRFKSFQLKSKINDEEKFSFIIELTDDEFI